MKDRAVAFSETQILASHNKMNLETAQENSSISMVKENCHEANNTYEGKKSRGLESQVDDSKCTNSMG